MRSDWVSHLPVGLSDHAHDRCVGLVGGLFVSNEATLRPILTVLSNRS